MIDDLNFEKIVIYLTKNYPNARISSKELYNYLHAEAGVFGLESTELVNILIDTEIIRGTYGDRYYITQQAYELGQEL